jgi:hypothetical protein
MMRTTVQGAGCWQCNAYMWYIIMLQEELLCYSVCAEGRIHLVAVSAVNWLWPGSALHGLHKHLAMPQHRLRGPLTILLTIHYMSEI